MRWREGATGSLVSRGFLRGRLFDGEAEEGKMDGKKGEGRRLEEEHGRTCLRSMWVEIAGGRSWGGAMA